MLLIPLIWLAACGTIYPRVGEIHAMAQLPFAAVMSGLMLAKLRTVQDDLARLTLAGLAVCIGAMWAVDGRG